jgi:MFS family permease
MQKPLFAALLFSALLVSIVPLTYTMPQLLIVITLMGVTSGFFGQSVAWAAGQIEEKVRRGQENNVRNKGKAVVAVHSHVIRGIGFNRMIGDFGLILGPLFIGYLTSTLSKDPLSWLVTFGLTSAMLGAASFLIMLRSGSKNGV